jgi:hypothetical protein
MKMKTIVVLLSLISIGSSATEYSVNINNSIYKNAIIEEASESHVVTCESPNILNESETECYNPLDSVSWILRDNDSCNGIRQANFDPNVYFIRSNTANENANLLIPNGFHWVTRNEYRTLFAQSTVANKNDGSIYVYKNQCGLNSAPYLGGTWQASLIFSDEGGVYYGHTEQSSGQNNTYNYSGGMLGYVLYKD